jgi:hypothetical protein
MCEALGLIPNTTKKKNSKTMYVSIINPLNILASLQTGKITAMVHIEHGEIHKKYSKLLCNSIPSETVAGWMPGSANLRSVWPWSN